MRYRAVRALPDLAPVTERFFSHDQLPLTDKPCMERRREPRIQAFQKVDLILLGDNAPPIDANATQFSGNGLRLVLKQSVPVGAAVKVQGDDWLVLGEVCYCRKERLNFVVGLQLEHSLTGLRQLEELNRKFMSDFEPMADLVAVDVA